MCFHLVLNVKLGKYQGLRGLIILILITSSMIDVLQKLNWH